MSSPRLLFGANEPIRDKDVIVQQTVDAACEDLSLEIDPRERRWVGALIDTALSQRKEGGFDFLDRDETVTELFKAALEKDRPRIRALYLAAAGKKALLMAGGIGDHRVIAGETAVSHYRAMAALSLSMAAGADPTIDAQYAYGEGELIVDEGELQRLNWALQKMATRLSTPWLARVAKKVPELSGIIQWTGSALMGNDYIRMISVPGLTLKSVKEEGSGLN